MCVSASVYVSCAFRLSFSSVLFCPVPILVFNCLFFNNREENEWIWVSEEMGTIGESRGRGNHDQTISLGMKLNE